MPSRYRFDRAPARIYWEITRACGLACRHCRAEAAPDADPAELTTEQGFALLDRIAAFGDPLPHLVLTGGDPLERADLFALIAHAQERGLAVSVSPSGTPRLNAEAIGRLAAARVEAISLSLDGSTAERHDAIRGVPGCFERTLQAGRAATDVGLMFQVNTLVARETLDDLERIKPVVEGMRAARWSLFFLVAVGRGAVLSPISPAECDGLFRWLGSLPRGKPPIVTTTEAPHYRRILLERMRDAPPTPGRPPIPGLGIRDGNGILFVSSTGDVSPSGFLPLVVGNVREQDVTQLYRSHPIFTALRQPETFEGRCGRCEYREPCGGSRARAHAATGSILGDDPLCDYQPRG